MGGMAVSPVTLRPVEKGSSEREKLEEALLESQMNAALEAERKLKTKGGKIFLDLIQRAVQRRIEELVNKDPHAQALLGLLNSLGHDIQVGEAAARRLTEIRLGRQARDIPNIG